MTVSTLKKNAWHVPLDVQHDIDLIILYFFKLSSKSIVSLHFLVSICKPVFWAPALPLLTWEDHFLEIDD